MDLIAHPQTGPIDQIAADRMSDSESGSPPSLLVQVLQDTTQRPRDVETETEKNQWIELGYAPSFRIKLSPEIQIHVLNEIRKQHLLGALESDNGIVGYITSFNQYLELKKVIEHFSNEDATHLLPTKLVIGLSSGGDSRIRYFSDNGAIALTSSALIAGTRALAADGHYTYLDKETKQEVGYALELPSGTNEHPSPIDQAHRLVQGQKNQTLRQMPIEEYFQLHQEDMGSLQNIPDSLFDQVKEEIVEIHDATSFNVFQIDINGFSASVKETLGKSTEALTYLTLITDFLHAFEKRILELSKNPDESKLFTPHFGPWEGDALPIVCESQYVDYIAQAFEETLHDRRFSTIDAKAVAIHLGDIKVSQIGKRAHPKLPEGMDLKKFISTGESLFKRHYEGKEPERGAYVRVDTQDVEATATVVNKHVREVANRARE